MLGVEHVLVSTSFNRVVTAQLLVRLGRGIIPCLLLGRSYGRAQVNLHRALTRLRGLVRTLGSTDADQSIPWRLILELDLLSLLKDLECLSSGLIAHVPLARAEVNESPLVCDLPELVDRDDINTLHETQIGFDHVLLDATPSDVRENARDTKRNSLKRVTVLGEVRLLLS